MSNSIAWPKISRSVHAHFFAASRRRPATPLAYFQRLRTEAAKRMLEDDRMTIQEVGLAVGCEDAAFFRDLFKRHAGLAPGAYRERYGRSARPHES
jgi:transcriptional regulator GlxA family with amidase domain